MSILKREKVKLFMSDKEMSEAVMDIITRAFLKPVPHNDVHVLAAHKIATDLLEDAFKELKKFVIEKESVEKKSKQIGL